MDTAKEMTPAQLTRMRADAAMQHAGFERGWKANAINVAGVSNYQDTLRGLASKWGNTPALIWLLPENNSFDENSMRVEIDGLQVGYLPKAKAKKARAIGGPVPALGYVIKWEKGYRVELFAKGL
jgi:hypothetical protein